MPSEARQKKIMEKLNRVQKCSILGPQNLGSGGARAPGAPPGSAPAHGEMREEWQQTPCWFEYCTGGYIVFVAQKQPVK